MTPLTTSSIGHEILDDPAADPARVRRMLTDITRANRLFGGVRSLHVGLSQLLSTGGGTRAVHLLDIGTGAGDLPRAATRWGTRHGWVIRPVGLERHVEAARLASALGTPTAVGCGGTLPIGDRSVDVVLISQLLHHLDDDSAVQLLTEADRVARVGVMVLDLRPSRLSAMGFRMVGPLLRFATDTTDDGVISLARGRTARSLGLLAARAGAIAPRATTLAMARVVVTWRTAPA